MKFFLFIVFLISTVFSQEKDRHHPDLKLGRYAPTQQEDAAYWRKLGEDEIAETLKAMQDINTNIAKNVIIFVGDGMSLPTVTASRIYKAQYDGSGTKRKEVNGEESLLFFETFPHGGLSKTYCVNAQTPDSAATANAMFTGVKTNYYTMGFDNSIDHENVTSEETANKVDSILKWAQDAGKDTGFVTTTRISHATPAALYAHSSDRYFECNKNNSAGVLVSTDITHQFVNSEPGRHVKVAMGGGRSSFLPKTATDETSKWNYADIDWDCLREDEKHLINEYLNKNETEEFKGKTFKLVENRGELNAIDTNSVDYLLGLFSWGYMKYEHQREKGAASPTEEPSIAEMTNVAIKMLKKNKNGFFLMVEGGKIDVAHHDGFANTAMHETMAMDLAIETAFNMTDPKDTLIIVTADHGHTMAMAGYQSRGADIRGIVDNANGADQKSLSILNYANGPGFYDHLKADNNNVSRVELNDTDYTAFENHQPSAAPLNSETHSGSDVGIFATGPYAHFFRTVHEQNYIAYVMAYSSCLGPYSGEKCHTVTPSTTTTTTTTTTETVTSSAVLTTTSFIFLPFFIIKFLNLV